ncbi:hypothetical protein JRQ81_005269, partial [Phrynocephalus forsythii]
MRGRNPSLLLTSSFPCKHTSCGATIATNKLQTRLPFSPPWAISANRHREIQILQYDFIASECLCDDLVSLLHDMNVCDAHGGLCLPRDSCPSSSALLSRCGKKYRCCKSLIEEDAGCALAGGHCVKATSGPDFGCEPY